MNIEPYKEETMEGKIESFEILESHCANEVKIEFDPAKFEILKRDNGYYVVRKQPQYPKTYEECCKVLGYSGNYNIILTTDVDNKLFNAFYRLKVCRDAYWKMTGDWKPDWNNSLSKSCIAICENQILRSEYVYANIVLAFPSEEMRDAFYENFKDLIEECKELL